MASPPTTNPAARRVEDDLRRYLQTDVKVNLSGDQKGSIRSRSTRTMIWTGFSI